MKRIYFLIAAATCMAFVACNKEQADPTPVVNYDFVTFKTFGFTAEKNPGVVITDDIAQDPKSGKLEFALPFGTDEAALKTLIPTFELSLGTDKAPEAKVLIAGVEYKAGNPIDFSSIVDFTINNGNKNVLYSVSVSIKNAPAWKLAATSDIEMGSEMIMKINPKDKLPYMLGYVKGSSASEHYPILLGIKGDKLSAVADTLEKVQAGCFGLDFDMNGTGYVTYYDNPSKLQVSGKISGNKFTKIGTTIRSTCNTVTSAPVAAIDNNNVFFGCMANAATSGVAKRGLYVAKYDGSTLTHPVQIGDWALSTLTYNAITRKVNGVDYMLCLDFSNVAIAAYKYEKGAWTNIIGSTVKPKKVDGVTDITTAEYTYQSFGFDVDNKGNIYVLAHADFDGTTKNPAVIKFDPVTKTQTIIGGVIKNENFTHSKCRYAAVAVDAIGNPYVIFANTFTQDKGGACSLLYIDSKTKSWSAPVTISTKKINGVDIKFNADNKGYVCVFNATDSKYELYTTE